MATRPVFLADDRGPPWVAVRPFEFPWHGGFARSQSLRNIDALHAAAAAAGLSPLLEISTRSRDPLGQQLSAFVLQVPLADGRLVALECVFQASKRFASGGPFLDLLELEPGRCRREPRLRQSGALLGFEFEAESWPLQPPTAFYDWLYLRALARAPQLAAQLDRFAGFTDIAFNPARSINCQARAAALHVALAGAGCLAGCMRSQAAFLATLRAEEPGTARRQP